MFNDIVARINLHLNQQRPFAAYAKPGSNTLCALFQENATAHILDNFDERGFVFAPFAGGQTCIIPLEASAVVTADIPNEEAISCTGTIKNNPDAKAAFEALVAKGVSAIKSGAFEKLVLSRTEAAATNHSATAIFSALLSAYPQAMRYCFYHPLSGLWIGATPEQLLKAHGKIIQTVALAGTQLFIEGQQAVWPEKEQQEQRFVTDYIVSELAGITDSLTPTAPYTYRAGNIVHIKTDIAGHLKETATVADAIKALHPTPAVCGLPKAAARDFIIASEGYDRSYYSGFLGELNFNAATGNDSTDLFVNLRCLRLEGNTAHLYIGCGVTADSDPEKEFIETVNKSMTMRRVL